MTGETPEIVVVQSVQTPVMEVQLRRFDFQTPFTGGDYAYDTFRVDFGLTPRPSGARGRYLANWASGHAQLIGNVMVAPPRVPLQTSGGPGRANSLTCYLRPDLLEVNPGRWEEGVLDGTLDIRSAAIRQSLSRVLSEITRPTFMSPLALEATGLLLAADLSLHFAKAMAPEPPKKGGLSRSNLRLIEERIRAPLPLPRIAELAQLCGLTERHLARAFQQEIGSTLGAYVAAAGLERARRLLTDTRQPIRQIAAHLGFASGPSFASAFRRATGLSPSDVRKTAQGSGF